MCQLDFLFGRDLSSEPSISSADTLSVEAYHSPFFALVIFLDRVSLFLPQISLGSRFSYTCLSVAQTKESHHPAQLVSWDGVLLTFCPQCPLTIIVLISVFQLAGIQGWAITPCRFTFFFSFFFFLSFFLFFFLCGSLNSVGPCAY
jgi:hypothetical protein